MSTLAVVLGAPGDYGPGDQSAWTTRTTIALKAVLAYLFLSGRLPSIGQLLVVTPNLTK